MIIDIHCHYTFTQLPLSTGERFSFEPADEPGFRGAFDSCISPRAFRRMSFRAMRRYLHVGHDDSQIDARLADFYGRHLAGAGPVRRWVLLAFDAYHDSRGERPPLPRRAGDRGSDIYTSNSLIRATCQRHPERFLFGASVHPYRADALACLDEVFAAGACLLKLIPLHQNVDARDERTIAFLAHCAELGLPVLLHYGPEFTLTSHDRALGELPPLLDVLRHLHSSGSMPTTIIPHLATPVNPAGPWRNYNALVDALTGSLADAPLYGDVSALCSWGKVWSLRQIARRQELHHRLLFGSDFPIPPAAAWLRWRLGSAWQRISEHESWSNQAAEICRCMGFNETVLHRAAELLPNVDFFTRADVAPA